MSSPVDSLASMFPAHDRQTLQAALDAHGGSVERTVDHLLRTGTLQNTNPSNHRLSSTYASNHSPDTTTANLGIPTIVYDSGNPIADRALARQLEQDEIMARSLALEEERLAAEAIPDSPLAVARGFASTVAETASSLPSMVTPVINGFQYAGKVAADAVSAIYEEIVHTAAGVAGTSSSANHTHPATGRPTRGSPEQTPDFTSDDTHVIHGDAASPTRPGLQARPRRTPLPTLDPPSGQKKRE